MAMNLARLAFELKILGKNARIVIVDPDHVEQGNIPRSNFCFAEIGTNKAERSPDALPALGESKSVSSKKAFTPRFCRAKMMTGMFNLQFQIS